MREIGATGYFLSHREVHVELVLGIDMQSLILSQYLELHHCRGAILADGIGVQALVEFGQRL